VARASARRLLEALPREHVRVGPLTFAEQTRVRAGPGSLERTRAVLESLRTPLTPEATDLVRAIYAGVRALHAGGSDGHRKILLLLSDGHATRPGIAITGSSAAHRAAHSAARQGVALYTIAIGPDAADVSSSYASLAALTDGIFAASRDLGPLLAHFSRSRAPAPPAQLEIVNSTTGDRDRALRLFPDGSFDGFVRLVPGRNRIAVRALEIELAGLATNRRDIRHSLEIEAVP
jgi:hypothetical protein